MKRIFFWPDVHVPFEDKRSFALAYKVAKDFKPDIQVVLGDFWDCYSVSAHTKSEKRKLNFVTELQAGAEKLQQLMDLKVKRNIFCEGNHEVRLNRYIADKAPELDGWGQSPLDIAKEQGWETVPYKRHAKVGKLYVTHDVGHAGKYAIHQSQSAFEANVVIGHLHRAGQLYTGSVRGDRHTAACFGWLGDHSKVSYMFQAKMREWVQGFGIGYMEKTGVVHLRVIPIIRGKCVVEGKLYK